MTLEHRSVVSVLIFPPNPYATTPHRVLLFRRSDKVRTYRGKLAPIAGSIEASDASPLSAAWRELKEETGLGAEDIELWRRGPGFEFVDETAVSAGGSGKEGNDENRGRTWKVWPFAFRLKRELELEVPKVGQPRPDEPTTSRTTQVSIDWEHTGYEWRTIDEILGNGKGEGKETAKLIVDDCVPRLEVTLGQVWVSPDSALHQGLERLRLDHSNGARQLATMAVETLVELITDLDTQADTLDQVRVHGPEAWWRDFRLQAFHLAFNARPSMAAAISKSVATALSRVGDVTDLDPEFPGKVRLALKSYLQQRNELSKRVGVAFSAVLKERYKTCEQEETKWIKILTLSSSSTIKAAVICALEDNPLLHLEIRVLESRPLFEGVSFAEFLTDAAATQGESGAETQGFRNRLRVVIGTDCSVGILSQDIDLLILGADRISEAGDVSNKTGSLPAALTSKHITQGKCRVICISETDKIAPPGSLDEHGEEDNDPSEVSKAWNLQGREMNQTDSSKKDSVHVSNVYFEWVPAGLIDYYVCEDGVLPVAEIARQSQEMAVLIDQVFSDL
ncbi:uncharacterized protein A1O9_10405 [Exophiala aquamarina CBS 119918]|uniref:Nudix hydrolase domain-containing protein n=1 Tax=Exophiala aquamarina CBS 119918 TaxID=1182545 RepID=A0A072PCZ1_9EURO|nr:uncharacterized protein A1O9_10405 [Exophiala aquamarina CBS 119918]KEF53430.1 hypothetical protein A1O9_10405 [Exophiala aquamarina CBS 119918]